MIVRMTKYDIVVYHRERDEFLARLQELGLVDVTTAGWEPDEEQSALLSSIERHRAAVEKLRKLAAGEGFEVGRPYPTADEAWAAYNDASARIEALDGRITAATKDADGLRMWGRFDAAKLRELAANGVIIRFFSVYSRDFEAARDEWERAHNIVVINEENDTTYFAVITTDAGREVSIDAQELPVPTATAADREREVEELEKDRAQAERILARAAASVELIERQGNSEAERLDLSRVAGAGASGADGRLIVFEGWATRDTAAKVDAMLDAEGVYYERSHPAPDDEVPVKLRNRRWSSPFELIGNFYSLPRYGSIDLTAFFGPFYMLFFGFCLGDAGYGLLFVVAALILWRIARKKGSRFLGQAAALTLLCGAAAVAFGFMAGGFFGVQLAELQMFTGFRDKFLNPNMLFLLALGLGVVQILFALVLKMANTTAQFGFKHCLGTLGWFMVVCALLYFAMPNATVHEFLPALTIDYPVNMPVYYAVTCAGVVLMLFFHNPDRNPLVNFGGGLWNTYNDVTGLLGDLLSYIRLFALCLSGGTLALVFNQLAMQTPVPAAIVILILGHAINLFMSTLGSFVHPMRLTFVEFYKNAGFEAAQREFKPLRKTTK